MKKYSQIPASRQFLQNFQTYYLVLALLRFMAKVQSNEHIT